MISIVWLNAYLHWLSFSYSWNSFQKYTCLQSLLPFVLCGNGRHSNVNGIHHISKLVVFPIQILISRLGYYRLSWIPLCLSHLILSQLPIIPRIMSAHEHQENATVLNYGSDKGNDSEEIVPRTSVTPSSERKSPHEHYFYFRYMIVMDCGFVPIGILRATLDRLSSNVSTRSIMWGCRRLFSLRKIRLHCNTKSRHISQLLGSSRHTLGLIINNQWHVSIMRTMVGVITDAVSSSMEWNSVSHLSAAGGK